MRRRDALKLIGAGAAATLAGLPESAQARAFTTPLNPMETTPMRLLRSADRGYFDHGWLRSFHSFSFADYQNPDWVRFRSLRVINEDYIAPGRGFGTHPHRDMEIITYVLDGAVAHKDSMGNGSTILPGDVQRMSAGTGITHSEFNPQADKPTHLLQIWLFPDTKGVEPSYEQTRFDEAEKRDRLRLVASPDGAQGSVRIQQDARLYASLLGTGRSVTHTLAAGRGAWIHVVRGSVTVAGVTLTGGDGAGIDDAGPLTIAGVQDAEVLLFDMA